VVGSRSRGDAFGALDAQTRTQLQEDLLRLWNLGRIDNGFAQADLKADGAEPFMEDVPSGFGALHAVRHSAILSKTPAYWARPAVPLGTDKAKWPAR